MPHRYATGPLLSVLLLVLLLIQAQYVQATTEVFWVVIPSWADPDTDDGNNITPLNAGDIVRPNGRAGLIRLGLSGSLKPSGVVPLAVEVH